MIFKVEKWSESLQCYECLDEKGNFCRIDLLIDGSLVDSFSLRKVNPQDLIGKTVEVGWVHAYIMIAHNVKIIEEA